MNKKERNDLIISWLAISAAFAMILSSGISIGVAPLVRDLAEGFLMSLIAVGTGFIFHELAHKYVAIHYGAQAQFRAWNMGLMITIATGLLALFTPLRFLFAAPGAVWIYKPNLTRKENGIISLAGPMTNIIIAGFFFFMALMFPAGFLHKTLVYGFIINIFLALFNLLPIGPLDGKKVMEWDVKIWAAVFVPLVLFYLFVL